MYHRIYQQNVTEDFVNIYTMFFASSAYDKSDNPVECQRYLPLVVSDRWLLLPYSVFHRHSVFMAGIAATHGTP